MPETRSAAEDREASADDDREGAEGVSEGETDLAEIYVNVGRRDGAKPSDYQTVLETGGLTLQQTDYIRVRHRHAFVGVRPEFADKALEVLNGATIAGKRASAERARRL